MWQIDINLFYIQNQQPEVFCKKKLFLKISKFLWKTSVLEALSNKFAGFSLKKEAPTHELSCENWEI